LWTKPSLESGGVDVDVHVGVDVDLVGGGVDIRFENLHRWGVW